MNKVFNVLKQYNIDEKYFHPHGYLKGKIDYNLLYNLENKKNGKLILVTSINPTPAGEGKTTVSIGLSDGLNLYGKRSVLALREPSMGPVFGIKGGAAGGGASHLVPTNDINLHFTGDFHAITSANNLLSALIDAHIFYDNDLKFKTVLWNRTLDVNDRSLRTINTPLRDDNFTITAASEIMAVLSLASSIDDLTIRLNNMLIGLNDNDKPIYVKDLGCVNALVALLSDAINPNVVLTNEGNPALVHCGPFANIAHGCNSLLSTKLALKMGEYTVTEAGFGADLGMEKFLDLKQPVLNNPVDLVVLVATIHSLKYHGGAENYHEDNLDALIKGLPNLEKHIENIKNYNLNFVIAINKHTNNNIDEINYLINWAKEKNYRIEISDSFDNGGKGNLALANLVDELVTNKSINNTINHPYSLTDSPKDKILKLAKIIYGASDVKFTKKALNKLKLYNDFIKELPVCIAKTPASLSDDSKLIGRPTDFTITIRDIRPSTGAGFFVAVTKGINIMPGLNKHSNAYNF